MSKKVIKIYKTILSKLRDFYYEVTKLKSRTLRSLAYAKQGWGSEDWDYAYAIRDMIFKFTRMAKTIRDNKIIESNEKVHDDIMELVHCLNLLIDDVDEKPYWNEYYEKYGYPKMIFIPIDGGQFSTHKMVYPKVITKEQDEEREKLYWELIKREEKEHEENLDKICFIFKNKLQTFWD
jgi:hypothetical protein